DSLLVVELHREESARACATGAQGGGDHDGAGEVLLRGTGLLRLARVAGDAVRALRGRGDRQGDEFADEQRERLVLRVEHRGVEILELLERAARRLPQGAQV